MYFISGDVLEFDFVTFATNFLSSNAVKISGKIFVFFHNRKSSLMHNSSFLVWDLNSFSSFGRFISKRKSSEEVPIFDLNLANEFRKYIIISCKIDT